MIETYIVDSFTDKPFAGNPAGVFLLKLLMAKNLIDEYLITLIPTFLGDCKRLFKGGI